MSRPQRKPAELLLVPMIDIFTVLVTFLLMTAVFSRIVIMQIDLPTARPAKPDAPRFWLEVIVRQDRLRGEPTASTAARHDTEGERRMTTEGADRDVLKRVKA